MIFAKTQEKRNFLRLKFTNIVSFYNLNELDFGGCSGCDLSEGGIRLNVFQFIPVETELSLQIEFSKDNVLHCTGRVKWVEVVPIAERFRIGIKFENFDSPIDFKNELQRMLKDEKSSEYQAMNPSTGLE